MPEPNKPLRIYSKDKHIFVYDRNSGRLEDTGHHIIEDIEGRPYIWQFSKTGKNILTAVTDIGHICARGLNTFYSAPDLLIAADYDPAMIYVTNTNYNPDIDIVCIQITEMRLSWNNRAPRMTLLGEQSLFVNLSGKSPKFKKSDNGGSTVPCTRAEVQEIFQSRTGEVKMLTNTFPALNIYPYSINIMTMLRTLNKHKGTLNTEPLPETMAYALRCIDIADPLFQCDFSEYKPIHECLNLSEKQYEELLAGIPKDGPGAYSYTSYCYKALNYVVLFLLKAHNPACFNQSVKDMSHIIQDAGYFYDVLIAAYYRHGISIQDLMDYIQSQMERRRSPANLMTQLRTWLNFEPATVVQKTLPDKLEMAIKAATAASAPKVK